MKNMLHHIAICVTNYEWHIQFFKEVFGMHEYREIGEAPNRKIWFEEGIQLDELEDGKEALMTASFPSHIGLQTDNLEEILKKAFQMGCVPYGNKHHWFALPNGLKIEMKENPPVVLTIAK